MAGVEISEHGYMGSNADTDECGHHHQHQDLPKHTVTTENIQTAAVCIVEGEKEDVCYHHPKGRWSRGAYFVLHHWFYATLHLIATFLFMLLVAPNTVAANSPIKFTVEVLLLLFLTLHTILRYVWYGVKDGIRNALVVQRRSALMLLLLILMFIDIILEWSNEQHNSHIRVIRALRSLFLIDNYLLSGVRRILRNILTCVKVLDVLLLLLFLICVFSLVGYLSFESLDPTYFGSFVQSFVSLFVTMTTSNNPDVMMESYFENDVTPLFFFVYLVTTVYFVANMLLAVVYGNFEEQQEIKFKKIYLHRRMVLKKAYKELCTCSSEVTGITSETFLHFMGYYRPRIPKWQVMCIFKELQRDQDQTVHDGQEHIEHMPTVCEEQFYKLYEVKDLRWQTVRIQQADKDKHISFFKRLREGEMKCYNNIYTRKVTRIIMNFTILANILFLVCYVTFVEGDPMQILRSTLPLSLSFVFTIVYLSEIILKIILLGGPQHYFRKIRNVFDFSLILISLLCLSLEVDDRFSYLVFVRPIKLLRLLKFKRRYANFLKALELVLPRLIDIVLLLIIIYYFFAIIGIEYFHDSLFEGCCRTSWYGVQAYYTGEVDVNATDSMISPVNYYDLNFNTVHESFVTLFVLMIVNNWFIIMEGVSSEAGNTLLARFYFMAFYIVTLVIIQVFVAYIVDEFKFKLVECMGDCPKHNVPLEYCLCAPNRKMRASVKLQKSDFLMVEDNLSKQSKFASKINCAIRNLKSKIKGVSFCMESGEEIQFKGTRVRNKYDIQLEMYKDKIIEWTKSKTDDKSGDPVWKKVLKSCTGYLKNVMEYMVE